MLYPKKINAKKSNRIIKIFVIISILVAILLKTINIITSPKIPWASYAICGIIYVWVILLYSIKKNINIAGHVLLQTITISILSILIDYNIGFKGWSINIAIPITIIISNITMLVLTIVSYRKYIKYAIYQLIIVLFSMMPIILIYEKISQNIVLSFVASGISILNLTISLSLSFKDIKEEIIRKFHM